jgi:hypothetical protein
MKYSSNLLLFQKGMTHDNLKKLINHYSQSVHYIISSIKTCWSLVSYLCMWGIWNCPFVQYLIVSFHWSLHLLLQIRCMSCSNWSPSSFFKISPNCCMSKAISSWSLLSRDNNLSIKKTVPQLVKEQKWIGLYIDSKSFNG